MDSMPPIEPARRRTPTAVLMPAILVLAACAAGASPPVSLGPSAEPSPQESIAPEGPPTRDLAEAASLDLHLEGGPDWPTELDGSIWLLAPDGPLRPEGLPPLVFRLDPQTGEEQAQVVIPGRFCQGMEAAFDALWVCVDEGMVRIDPATNAIVAEIAFPAPQVFGRPAISPDAVWSLSGDIAADRVVRVDPTTNAVTATYPLGHAVLSLSYGFDALWASAASDGILLRIDPASGAVTEHVTGLPSPSVVTTGAGSIWVLLYGSRDGPSPAADDPTVARIDPSTGTVTLVGPAGSPARDGDIAATDDGVWVRGPDPFLVRLDSTTGEIDQIVTANFAGGSVRVAFGSVWVTSVEFGRVWRIDP